MIEIRYKRRKLIWYNIIIILAIILFSVLSFVLFREKNFFLLPITLFFALISIYSEIYLFKTFQDKWIVKFDDDFLLTNKSLCSLKIPKSEIICIEGYYQQGRYYQIGINIKNASEIFKNLSAINKFNLKLNLLLTKYNLIIPGYLIEGNPEEICEKLNEILAYD